jgi:hypothetical protein
MLSRYLADIDEWLALGESQRALQAAITLPHIATALSDPALCTNCEKFVGWCAQWDGTEQPSTYSSWLDESGNTGLGTAEGTPVHALKQMRLRRHARPAPLPAQARRGLDAPEETSADRTKCESLVQAMRTWYARSGVRDDTVQMNLARLAVLR